MGFGDHRSLGETINVVFKKNDFIFSIDLKVSERVRNRKNLLLSPSVKPINKSTHYLLFIVLNIKFKISTRVMPVLI